MFKVLALCQLLSAHGLGNSSQGAAHLGALPETNVARHRPCKPRPACLHLVDGLLNLTDRAEVNALARTAKPSPVLIFLKAPTLVTQIVVHLVYHGHPGAGRHLMISLWNSSGDLGPPTKRWSWDPQKAVASGSFRVVVPVDRVATAVAVQWETSKELPELDTADSVSENSEIWISEVSVLSRRESFVIEHETPLPKNEFTTSVQMHSFEAVTQEPTEDTASDKAMAEMRSQSKESIIKSVIKETMTQSGLPPSGLPPSGLPPSGLPPSGLPPSGLPPSVTQSVMKEDPLNVKEEIWDDKANRSLGRPFRSVDPHFLSPWPTPRRSSSISLKAMFGALLAGVLLAMKFKSSLCLRPSKRANDLESYDYGPLPNEERHREERDWEWQEVQEAHMEQELLQEVQEVQEVVQEVQELRAPHALEELLESQVVTAVHTDTVHHTEAVWDSTSASSRSRTRSLSCSDRTISEPEGEPSGAAASACASACASEDEAAKGAKAFESFGPFGFRTKGLRQEIREVSEPNANEPNANASGVAKNMMMLYASPLCFSDGRGMKALPQIPVEKEWETVLGAYNEASHILSCNSSAASLESISAQTLTAGSLQRALCARTWPVLHLSSHGVKDCLVLEDGNGTAHFFSCSMLRGMLELAGSVRLVVLNACSLSSMGSQFTEAGVPHVVCCSADLKDSASHIFLRAFYSNLFQGSSVQRAFHSALVALRSHSERSAQAASHHFRLLPEGQHEEILFPSVDLDSQGRRRRRLRRTNACALQVQSSLSRQLPALPEDFLGRELDVWSVLQQLNQRRAVVVCSAPGEGFGIGKTAVLDSVQRTFTLLGHTCVPVHLRSLSQASWPGDWIDKASAAVRGAISECRGTRPGGSSRRRGIQGPLRTGFHPLSDPLTTACLLEDFIEDLLTLAELCDRVEWTSPRILLLLDECDHLVQQQQFQDALAVILQRCSSYSVVLSTHQPMVPSGASKFKVVQHRLQGLPPRDAARLLLRRAQRPLRWGEVRSSADPSSLVILNKENESEVLDAVSAQPRVAALKGNPRRLIELANHLDSLTE